MTALERLKRAKTVDGGSALERLKSAKTVDAKTPIAEDNTTLSPAAIERADEMDKMVTLSPTRADAYRKQLDDMAKERATLLRQLEHTGTSDNARIAEIDEKSAALENLLNDPSGLERVARTIGGGAKQYGSSHLNTIGMVSDALGGTAMSSVYESNIGMLDEEIAALERQAADTTLTEAERQEARDALEIAYRQRGIYTEANRSGEATGKEVYGIADAVAQSGAEDIERAKQGLGALGQLGVDLGVQGTQMLLDRALGGDALSLLALGTRAFGGGAQEARHEGATREQAALYGLGSAAVEVFAEKAVNGLAGLYGKGGADKIVKRLISRISKNANVQDLLSIAFAAGGEGLEEGFSGIMNPILKSIYNNKSAWENFTSIEIGDLMYDMLVGSIMGGFGGTVETTAGNVRAANILADEGRLAEFSALAKKYNVPFEIADGMSDAEKRRAVKDATKAIGDEIEKTHKPIMYYGQDATNGIDADKATQEAADLLAQSFEGSLSPEAQDAVEVPQNANTEVSSEAEQKATQAAYDAGRANVPREAVELMSEAQEEAYMEGRREYIKNASNEELALENEKTAEYTDSNEAVWNAEGANLTIPKGRTPDSFRYETVTVLSDGTVAHVFYDSRAQAERATQNSNAIRGEGVQVVVDLKQSGALQKAVADVKAAYAATRADAENLVGGKETAQKIRDEVRAREAQRVSTMNGKDGISNGREKGEQSVRRGSDGHLSQRAGEQAGRVSEGTEAVRREWGVRGVPKDAERESLTFTRKVSARTYLPQSAKEMDVYEAEATTTATKNAEALAAKNGLKLRLWGGGKIEIKTGNQIRGYCKVGRGEIGAQVDNPYVTAEDLTRHEIMEDKLGKRELTVDEVLSAAEKYVDADKIQMAVSVYYKGNSVEGIEGARSELVCDGADHINQLRPLVDSGATEFAELADVLDEVIGAINKVANDMTDNAFVLDDEVNYSSELNLPLKEREANNKTALDHFGKTYKWAETGYLLLDGTKLDFSGKHNGARGGYRTVDHREITDALGDDYGGGGRNDGMVQFMREGNIRIMPESGGINLSVAPTDAQESALEDFISKERGEVIVDLDDLSGNTVASVEYPKGTRASKVLADIRKYFKDGTVPHVSEVAQYRFSRELDADYLAAVERGDMETAQKMVDEAAKAAGYTEEVFHGMGHRHNVYKSGNGQYGEGVYFTYDKETGSTYGGVVDRLYVKVGKIADYGDAYDALGRRDDQTLDEFAQALGFPSFDDMVNDWENDPTNPESNSELVDLLMSKGFEGFVDEGNNGFVLWDFDGIEYRIKLADPVTYDDNGNVIPLSERFNPENDDIRYSREVDLTNVKLTEARAKNAIYEALDHADLRDDNLIGLSEIPDSISFPSGVYGNLYVYRNHLYENMVDEDRAKAEGRYNPNGHYHDTGEDLMEKALLALNNPSITIADQMNDGNPAMTLVLPVFDKNNLPIHAVISFYADEPINGVYKKRPHIAVTFYGHDYDVESSGRKSIIDVVTDAVNSGKVLSLDKNVRADLPVIAKRAPLGNITKSALEKNVARFQKFVNQFREQNKITYSRELPSLNELREENEELREKVAELKRQFTRSKAPSFKRADVEKLARKLTKQYDSELDASEIVVNLHSLANNLLNEADYKDEAARIARKIINESSVLVNGEVEQEYEAIKKSLRGRKIAIKDKGDIADFNDFRKRNFGRFTISDNGTPVDTLYEELRDIHGESYFPSNITHPADQLMHIADLFDNMQEVFENPFSYDMAAATESVANEIVETICNEYADKHLRVDSTYADRAAERVEKAEAREKKKTDKVRESLKRVREERDEKIASLKEKYRNKEKANRARRTANELRGKIARHAKKLGSTLLHGTDKKHIPDGLKESVAALLKAINLESAYETEFGTDAMFHRVKRGESPFAMASARTAAFIKLREQYKALAGEYMFDDELLEEVIALADTPIATMGVDDLTTIWNALSMMEKSVSDANKAFRAGKAATISEAAQNIHSDTTGKKTYHEFNNRVAERLRSLVNVDMLTPEAFFHRLGSIGESLFRSLRDAQDNYIRIMKEVVDFSRKTTENVNVKHLEKEMHKVTLGGKKVDISTAQLMELYVLMQREQARGHIFGGGVVLESIKKNGLFKTSETALRDITLDEVADAISLLSAEQISIAEKMQQFASNTLSEHGNEASMEVFNYKKFNEEFYWPIRSAGVKKTLESDTGKVSEKNKGFAKNTQKGAKNALKIGSIFDTFASHSSEMAHYASWLAVTEDINRIRNYKHRVNGAEAWTMEEVFNKLLGSHGDRYLAKLLEDITTGASGKSSDTGLTGGLSGKYKAAAVGANFRVIIQQPTSLLRAFDVIDPKWFANKSNALKGWNKAKKYAPIAQWKDWGYFDIGTGKQMKDLAFGTEDALDKVGEKLMAGAAAADAVSWGIIWNACEAEVKSQRNDAGTDAFYEAVAKRFAEVIDHTQVVDGILQRSQAMRNKSELAKMATSFMGEPTKQFNMLVSAIYDARGGDKAAKKKVVRAAATLILSGTINALAQSIVDGLRDDDREKEYLEKVLSAFVKNEANMLNPVQYIPYLKDVSSLIAGYDVSRMDMESISEIINSAKALKKALDGEGKYSVSGATTNFILDVARAFGIPANNIKRDVYAVIRTIAQESDNYLLEYEFSKLEKSLNGNKSHYISILYDAFKNDPKAYEIIYRDLVKNNAFKTENNTSSEAIASAMEKRMKEDQGVKSVDDLDERYLTPDQKKVYDKTIKRVRKFAVWNKANAAQRKSVEGIAYDLTVGNGNGERHETIIAGGKEHGLTEDEYLAYKLALLVSDEPNKSGKLGTYTNDEKQEALKLLADLALTEEEKSYLKGH